MSRLIAVLGAGVVGLCCALALQRRQFAVTLVDRADAGMGCSFGNAGMIQTGSVVPFASPAILRNVPLMLLDPQAALILRWRQVPRLVPWFSALLRNASAARVAASSRVLAGLLSEAKGAYRSLAGDAVIRELFRARGELYAYSTERAYVADSAKYRVFRDHGIAFEPLSGDMLTEREPALSPRYRHGYYLPDSEYVVDPQLLSKRLLELFLDAGGRFVQAEASELSHAQNGKVRLSGPGLSMVCDRLVIAAGSDSARLSSKLGIKAPVEPMRGYHVMVPDGKVKLTGPVIDGEMSIAATPMSGGIRLAGTLEFAGFSAPPDWRRAAMLLPLGQRLLPALPQEALSRWAGDRPGTPDGLPVIGRAAPGMSVWCAFGHGMLGLTLAAITGQLIALSILGAPTAVDLEPLGPGRFSKSVAA